MMTKKFNLYPFLFSLFPILSLTAYNISQIFLRESLRPLLFSLLLVGLVFGLFYLFLRDGNRAAVGTTIVLLLFFSYGQLYSAFEGRLVFGLAPFRHRFLLPLFGILALLAVIWITRAKMKFDQFRYGLNLLSIFLLVYPLFTILSTLIQQAASDYSAKTSDTELQQLNTSQPDVYYIILDAYGRQDILQQEFGFDNSGFLNALRERGFYVADCSQSNYAHTLYSLGSSLNYNYLDAIGVTTEAERITLLKHGVVRSAFESLGYQTVAFPTGWSMTEWTDADIYPNYGQSFVTLTEFETLFLDTTMLRAAMDYSRSDDRAERFNAARRMRVLSLIDSLKGIPLRDGNYFIFAHLVIPHPPYSFGPNGEVTQINTNKASYAQISDAYLDQIIFTNQQILQVVDAILSESETPPVIIIQGDHGPPPDLTNAPEIKMPILNAYYLPGLDQDRILYPSISPVNTFRVVLSGYFGFDLPLLEDKSYFAPNHDHTKLEEVPSFSCPAK
jgi:hypothetical protein